MSSSPRGPLSPQSASTPLKLSRKTPSLGTVKGATSSGRAPLSPAATPGSSRGSRRKETRPVSPSASQKSKAASARAPKINSEPGLAAEARREQGDVANADSGGAEDRRRGPMAPQGIRNGRGREVSPRRMPLTKESDLTQSFKLLDERQVGALTQKAAIRWLRCAGWCLREPELDAMLLEYHKKQRTKGGHAPEKDKWSLHQLLDVLDQNRHKANASVKDLQDALFVLSKGRHLLKKDRLDEISEDSSESFAALLKLFGLHGRANLDIEALAWQAMSFASCVPTQAGPGNLPVRIEKHGDPQAGVHLRFNVDRPLRILFDAYCKRADVKRESVIFKRGSTVLRDEDSYISLRLRHDEYITAHHLSEAVS
eukprot:TRINITY_DN106220_c0_g1_i1.p1 TRINITY_DN106220_c0_g1~~TRINITY_DN106220_c0_g1_i1.p1  ORF type:complete len:370 (+),score=46.81 TRINITY_DN106220_c0_g1_i1:32-1141(+)